MRSTQSRTSGAGLVPRPSTPWTSWTTSLTRCAPHAACHPCLCSARDSCSCSPLPRHLDVVARANACALLHVRDPTSFARPFSPPFSPPGAGTEASLLAAQWKGYTPDKSPLDQLPDRAYTWRGPGAPSPNPMDQLNTRPHVWKGPGPPAVNPMDQLDRTPYQVSCPTSLSSCAPPCLLPRAVAVACVGLGVCRPWVGACRALPSCPRRLSTLARSLAPALTLAPVLQWKGYKGEGKNVLDSLNQEPHVWKGPGTEGPNPVDALDSSRWQWRGPGPESHNVLGELKSEQHQWHGYQEPVNVLASLPTCIGLGCGETVHDVGQGIGRGAPVE